MDKEFLTRTECSAMRGIAIMAIMLHNYCHFIGRIVQENEYQYFTMNTSRLMQQLTNPDALLPVHLLSFFGHYGVPVFLFLSGYGLVRKYEATSQDVPVFRFVRYNYLKLLRMLIVGFVLFLMVDAVTPGRFAFHWDHVIAQLLMYINVLPEPDKIIWPGIYWFFGLMIELYIVYRLLLYRRNNWFVVGLIAVCWLLQVFCDPEGETLNRLRYNFIGGMLPFGMGILLARATLLTPHSTLLTPHSTLLTPHSSNILLLLASILLTFVMSFHYQTWLWIPVVIIIGTVALVKLLPDFVLNVCIWLGGLSAAMFVAHPIARKLFITVAWKQDIYDGLMLYVVVAIALSWAVKQVIDRIPSPRL
ncbi:MAG: acyltransferase [Prevotella sp.]|nr:acyltransferase [Prevotella sp.]